MNYAAARTHMVDSQIHPSGVITPDLLSAFETTPREVFVPKALQAMAYCDEDIIFEDGRFLLEPMILSKMLEAAELKTTDVVLDIGDATGYTAAVISNLVSTIVSLEQDQNYSEKAKNIWEQLQVCNTISVLGDLKEGYPEQAPFDVMILNGAVETIPLSLKQQLSEDGRIVAIVKEKGARVGRATLVKSIGPETLGEKRFSSYTLFDANTPYLLGFEPQPAFNF